jgi:hypothetical protein
LRPNMNDIRSQHAPARPRRSTERNARIGAGTTRPEG